LICKDENQSFLKKIDILIRGGEKIPMTIKARVVIPDIRIDQTEFNFGIISFNEKSTQLLSFKNTSNLSARILINFNTPNLKDFKVLLYITLS